MQEATPPAAEAAPPEVEAEPPQEARRPWPFIADGELVLAVQKAAQVAPEGKILVIFGADWCPDCHEVRRLLQEPLHDFVEANLATVFVDVGHFDRHQDILQRYEIDRIATLLLVDRAGEVRAKTTLEPITGDAPVSAETLQAWLQNPGPQPALPRLYE